MSEAFDIDAAARLADSVSAGAADLGEALDAALRELRRRNREFVALGEQLAAVRAELRDEERRSRDFRRAAEKAEANEGQEMERRREAVDALDTLRDQLSDLAHQRKDPEIERLAREAEAALRKAGR